MQRMLLQYRDDLSRREELLKVTWEKHLESVVEGHSSEVSIIKREFEKTKRVRQFPCSSTNCSLSFCWLIVAIINSFVADR